jgi:hypothetical protein
VKFDEQLVLELIARFELLVLMGGFSKWVGSASSLKLKKKILSFWPISRSLG